MDARTLKQVVRDSNQRLQRIEQILPTLGTKEDLRPLATREDLRSLATKEELRAEVAKLATKEELRAAVAKLATKEELRAAVAKLATKEELRAAIAPLATKEELGGAVEMLRGEIVEEGLKSRRHFDMVGESLRDEIRLLADSVAGTLEAHERTFKALGLQLSDHESRITRLEATRRRSRQ